MMAKYKDLKDYLYSNYYDEIFYKCKKYFDSNKYMFSLYSTNIPNPFKSDIDDLTITSLYSEDAEQSYIKIKAIVRLDVFIKGKTNRNKYSDIEEECLYRYVEVIIKTKFETSFEDLRIIEINHIDEKSRFNFLNSSTKNLVPYMQEKDLDSYAEKFLQAIYPNALKKPMKLPINKILERLGLTIKFGNLPDDVFGRIYFLDDEQESIFAKTIVVDKTKFFINGLESTKNTVIHECVHWFYHRRFFALQHLLDASLSSITCTQVESREHYSSKYTDDLRWMEWQANSLAPRILMPMQATIIKHEELFKWYQLEYQNNFVEIYKVVLESISDFFGVSKQLAKIRLIQLGFSQYIGINDFALNEKVSYVSSKEPLSLGDTYRISFPDFLIATYKNKRLKKAIEEEKIIYTNGFLVINKPKYVEKINGDYVLKDEALNAIDQCCLKFKIEYSSKRSMDKMYSMCYLCRSSNNLNDDLQRNYVDDQSNQNILNLAETFDSFKDDYEEENLLISKMNGTFNDAFKVLYDYLQMPSDSYAARLCGVDHKTISSYYNGTAKEPNYKKVLAICAGFQLRPRVSEKLLSTVRVDLSRSNQLQDHVYNMLIHICFEKGLDKWNELIKKAKLGDEHLLP